MNNIDFIHSQSQPNATSPCEHCLGTVEHEPWCVIRDPKVQYAYAIVNDPCALTYRIRSSCTRLELPGATKHAKAFATH
jgi:hypothetical protein